MNLGYRVTGARHLGPLAWALFLVQQYGFVGDKIALYSGLVDEVDVYSHGDSGGLKLCYVGFNFGVL